MKHLSGDKALGVIGKGKVELREDIPDFDQDGVLRRLAIIIAHCALLHRQPTPEEKRFVADFHLLFGDDGIKAAGMVAKKMVGLEGV